MGHSQAIKVVIYGALQRVNGREKILQIDAWEISKTEDIS